MKPLRVALVHREGERSGEGRMYGPWSYAVPEFTVTHYPMAKGFRIDRARLAERHDLIVYEDGKLHGTFEGRPAIPLVYAVVDSTLSEEHYRTRYEQARQADLVLVDWDDLARFAPLGIPVRRCSYSVNDLLFRDWGEDKTVDVACHFSAKGCPERSELMAWLGEFCRTRGYAYACGVREGMAYALALNRARVVVDLARNSRTRNHRTFDVMASGSCLLTSPVPEVSGEDHGTAGVHYETWRTYGELAEKIDSLLTGDGWWQIADAAHDLAHTRHTWRVRAAELRSILAEEFPQLGERAA